MSLEVDDWDFCQDIDALVKHLKKKLEDKESSIRISAVLGIALIGAVDSEFYESILTYLKSLVINDDLYIRGSAALSIGLLGATKSDDPVPLLDMLKLLLFDETRFVRRNASVGLAFISSSIESKEKRQKLIKELLTSAYWYFRIGGAL
ncbi:MAG: hypothetical protein ACTSQQ_10790, partial [Candidatus Helarchaeota archaeon]